MTSTVLWKLLRKLGLWGTGALPRKGAAGAAPEGAVWIPTLPVSPSEVRLLWLHWIPQGKDVH